MNTAAKFRLSVGDVEEVPLHYTACGLDDIYLLNGFRYHETPYGRGVSIENAEELHKAIGHYLIGHRKALDGKDLRFLRKNMNFTQDELAKCLGVTAQTIARYEKNQTEIPGSAEKLLRIIYAFYLLPEGAQRQFLEECIKQAGSHSDDDVSAPIYFGSVGRGWQETRPS